MVYYLMDNDNLNIDYSYKIDNDNIDKMYQDVYDKRNIRSDLNSYTNKGYNSKRVNKPYIYIVNDKKTEKTLPSKSSNETSISS